MEPLKLTKPEAAKKFFEDKIAYTSGPMDVDYAIKSKLAFKLIDVRRAEDYNEGHIPGAVSLPEDKWSSGSGLSKDKLNIVYCYSQTCHLAARACVFFATQGFPVNEMEGGFDAWKETELTVEKSEKKIA